jgi:hypothetical protein
VNATPEEWRAVPGYEGLYEVSNKGRVRSLGRSISFYSVRWKGIVRRDVAPRLLKLWTMHTGHQMTTLSRDGVSIRPKVHRLVLEAFVGPCPDGMEACHYDDEPANNVLENLRWDTRSANISDRYRNGWVAPGTAMTLCKKGLHPLTGDNLLGGQRQRLCRACRQEWERSYRSMKRRQCA